MILLPLVCHLKHHNLNLQEAIVSLPTAYDYRLDDFNIKKKGYQRDEIYAFYIAFIKNDGSMTHAFHIPGRTTIEDELDDYIEDTNQTADSVPIGEALLGDFFNYEYKDYSHLASGNYMNYWENKDEYYPQTDNYIAVDAEDPNTTQYNLQGERIKHHHFPKNQNYLGEKHDWSSIGDAIDLNNQTNNSTITGELYYAAYSCNASQHGAPVSWYQFYNIDTSVGTSYHEAIQIAVSPSSTLPPIGQVVDVTIGASGTWTTTSVGNTYPGTVINGVLNLLVMEVLAHGFHYVRQMILQELTFGINFNSH